MRTRRSPRNQEILWRSLRGTKPSPPRKLTTSKIKPVFNWETGRYVDPTDASYLDRLGTTSAARYAPLIKKQSSEAGISLPLPDTDVADLLQKTIRGLQQGRQVRWEETPTTRQQVFIDSWVGEMSRQGIRG